MNFQKNISLKDYSNYEIGGPARLFAEVETTEELREILKPASPASTRGVQRGEQVQDDKENNVFILGGGTNILINDKGFDGLVIHNKIQGILRQRFGQVDSVEVGSGVLIKDLLDFCIENSLSGLEWAGGLPGTVAGAVRGNAGAFKGETKDSVISVTSLDLKILNGKTRNNTQCQFNYRDSVFKSGEGSSEIIISTVFNLKPGNKEDIQKTIQEKIDYRNLKHPMDYPNIGSTFKNIPFYLLSEKLQKEFQSYVKTDPFPIVPTAKLLALAGLKGKKVGGAMISDKHPNFIINLNNATAEDVKALIAIAREAIQQKYGINLEEEIIYLS